LGNVFGIAIGKILFAIWHFTFDGKPAFSVRDQRLFGRLRIQLENDFMPSYTISKTSNYEVSWAIMKGARTQFLMRNRRKFCRKFAVSVALWERGV
jgi:hypothetical protein